jgi:uncharacterized protein
MARGGCLALSPEFLRFQMNPNARNELGSTPLHWGAYMGRASIVELLLRHKVEVDVEENVGATEWILFEGFRRGVLLTTAPPGESGGATAMMLAAKQGHEEIVELLLHHRARVDKELPNGVTALFVAAVEGRAKVVEILLQHNADATKSVSGGLSALDMTKLLRDETINEMLKAAGATEHKLTRQNVSRLIEDFPRFATILGYPKEGLPWFSISDQVAVAGVGI